MQWVLQKITQPVLAPNFLNILIQKVTGVLEDVLNTPTSKKKQKKNKKKTATTTATTTKNQCTHVSKSLERM